VIAITIILLNPVLLYFGWSVYLKTIKKYFKHEKEIDQLIVFTRRSFYCIFFSLGTDICKNTTYFQSSRKAGATQPQACMGR
jgi:hypothetical protein